MLGVQEFPATAVGYAGLLGWLGGFGTVALVGIEGTGSYGAGLARHVTAAEGPGRRGGSFRPPGPPPAGQVRSAGCASAPPGPPSPAGRSGAPKGRDGAVEAIRALMVAKRSARA